MRVQVRVWLLLALVAGCGGEGAPAAAPARATAGAQTPVIVPTALGHLSYAAAFDLVASSDGAIVAWSEAGGCEHSLRVQRLDADGRALGSSARGGVAACSGAGLADDAQVVELALAAGGGRLGVVWIAQDARSARVLGTHGADDTELLSPTLHVAVADTSARRSRGRLSLSASQTGQMRVAYRAPAAACVGEAGACAQLISRGYPPSETAQGRGSDAREVKAPCPDLLLGAWFASGTWYDAFCALASMPAGDIEPFTQVYGIRPEISYAEAIPTLRGCEALGVSPSPSVRGGVVVWGHCDHGLRAHVLALEGGERVLEPVTRTVSCAQGRPLLRVQAEADSFTLALDEPLSRLEQLLPEGLAPEGARAVFTGRRLIVAVPTRGALVLHRYVCHGDELVPERGSLL